jgi:hypothetical protein
MARLERWVVAARNVTPLDPETHAEVLRLGGGLGGSRSQVQQHIHVSATNKEAIEDMLRARGFTILSVSDPSVAGSKTARLSGGEEDGG